jgi:hypothetical protein
MSDKRKLSQLVGVRLNRADAEAARELAKVWDCSVPEVLRRALLRELRRV